MNLRASQSQRGFTLVELMVVMVIIAILAALTIMGMKSVTITSKNKKTASQIEAIKLGLEKYLNEYGEYPIEEDDTGAKCLYQALSGDGSSYIRGVPSPSGSNGEPGSSGKVMLNTVDPDNDPQRMVKKDGNDYILVDPFKNPYNYHADPARAKKYNETYDLWSYGVEGEDAADDTKKWITNW